MADAIRVSGPVAGTDKTLSFETGKLAQQSMGAVVATMGRTTVLATANAAKEARPGADFFPLTIDVEDYFQVSAMAPYIRRSEWDTRECRVEAHRDAMFAGEAINTTEGRAVLHTLLRAPRGAPRRQPCAPARRCAMTWPPCMPAARYNCA